ncbi:hypothetical protein IC762_26325 [Bradyrhizobium genosp. L]|uniref:hypothetical protein n=1 Tax=Bradyrhizobium genosp. L TaxID=83637 RepID=UPI0018A259C9|nr:hypothetical protein [Bradyrhizobium genosp. L]QPF83212.1 hypothetical protein IC762_26325 [Bradyrhizobium genosp. L]
MNAENLSGRRRVAAVVSLEVMIATLALSPHGATAQTVLPPDVKPTCIVAPTEFSSWFKTGKPEKDGVVVPANGLAFKADSLCPFYKWSAQMFLWLTSPVGPRAHVFASSDFFGIAPPDGSGKRKFVPQDGNKLLNFAPSISLVGSNGRPFVVDSTGKTREVINVTGGPTNTGLFRDKADRPVSVAAVAATTNGKPLLLDKSNKVLDVQTATNGAPLLRDSAGKPIELADQTVEVEGVQRLITTSGEVVEFGQAGGNAVLMTRNNGIVYYLLQANDVFAYFNTGLQGNKFPAPPPAAFPVDAATMDLITTIAKNAPPPNTRNDFQDRVALAMELKSSWVEASTLSNPGDYLTITATIPNFVPQGNTMLVPQGPPKTVDLALVGFHVVGSVAGHPEMLWATFEHVNNAPTLQYDYITTAGTPKTNLADGSGTWLFSGSAASAAPLKARMRASGANIVAVPNQTIGPVDVTRQNPWGTFAQDTDNNTDIVSLNSNVRSQLAGGDVRANYILTGVEWTDGNAPDDATNTRGTPLMANSTMETFNQTRDCFFCHRGGMLGGLSHIWDNMDPLFR